MTNREAPCNTTEVVECQNASGVLCEAALCEYAPVGSIAKCQCWKQDAGLSTVPPSGGAQCFLGTGLDGPAVCERMANGELWSTFFSAAYQLCSRSRPRCVPGWDTVRGVFG